ncbi:MAG: hypothetical protein M3441_19295 [Chloroflexota bacterium]|nr:hypothetical protein [Chloroflexota bacterium]
MSDDQIFKKVNQYKPLAEEDLQIIEARVAAIWPIGYLVTALTGSLHPDPGEEQAYLISQLSSDDVPALIRTLRRLQATLDGAQEVERVLREAVTFYAEEANYHLSAEISDATQLCEARFSDDGVIADGGLRARQALKATTFATRPAVKGWLPG